MDGFRISAKIVKIAENTMGDIMDMKYVIEYLPVDESFTKQPFSRMVREANVDYSGSAVSWLLSELKRKQKIASIGRGVYIPITMTIFVISNTVMVVFFHCLQ